MKQICINCEYAKFQLTEKGNIKRSRPGECEYKVSWPDLPACFNTRFFEPQKSAIWTGDGNDCKCFKAKEVAK